MTNIICEVDSLPSIEYYTETQYSIKKRRMGDESIPFMGLESGYHTIVFKTDKEERKTLVKTWYSLYGYAWQIIKNI